MKGKKRDERLTVTFRYTPGDGYRYRWEGGAYIDVYHLVQDDTGRWSEMITDETINVWDYEHDAPRIARNAESLMREVDAWRRERDPR